MCQGDDKDTAGAGAELQTESSAAAFLQIRDSGALQKAHGCR